MGSTKKRQRELVRLKRDAGDVWDEQRAVIDHARAVVKQASRQVSDYARNEVSPRIRKTVDERVKPAVASGAKATRHAASVTRDKLADDVVPAVSSALGSALSALNKVKRKGEREAAKAALELRSESRKLGKKVGVIKPSPGPGRYILIGLGVVAAAGLAYAVWQTLRADDDLWIEDEPEPLDPELSDAGDDAPAARI